MFLHCRNLSKSYAGVRALSDVDLDLSAGEAHGVVGANGAGKSTLVKILSGALPDHEGTIAIEGEEVRLSSPHEALERGIAMVYQELSGVPQLSVAENLFLGRQLRGRAGFLDWRGMRRRAAEILRVVDLDIDVTRPLGSYSLSVRQLIEIARCLDAGSRLFILDEPTSALSPPESRRLFDLIRRLKEEGRSVVFVSHFIEDVLEVCDRVTILSAGRKRETRAANELTKHEVIRIMLDGRESADDAFEGRAGLPPHTSREPILRARGLSISGVFDGIELALHPGETLGLYGFAGAGHQEVAHCLAGALRSDAGVIEWDGAPARLDSPARAVARGIAFVAADRAKTLVGAAEIYKNVTLAHLKSSAGEWLAPRREIPLTRPAITRVGCRPPEPMMRAGALSGGNQQKIVLAKWLMGPIRALILEEPTRGMDVGAKGEVMELVRTLKKEGVAILIATCEPELLLGHADRILVMRRGKTAKEFSGCEVDKAELMRHA
ncbi:sugar ABC transporter ATP-binding protein [Candidatus Sumerlaeota bacterium]|nr:sugar ABC transporter ATP-binding protein [Candidatus Sumerlaeota bacterium]